MSRQGNQLQVLSEDFIQNPIIAMRELQRDGKVHQVILPTGLKAWLVSDYENGRKLLSDKRLSKDVVGRHDLFINNQTDIKKQRDYSHGSMRSIVNMDPPDHTRMRTMLAKSFNFRIIEALKPKIELSVTNILNSLRGKTEFDLISDFSQVLTHEVISDLLGIPEPQRKMLREPSLVLCSDAPRNEATEALDKMTLILKEIIEAKKTNLQEDILSNLIKLTYEDKKMTESELFSNALLLFFGAFETTVNLIGNGIVAMIQNPSQMEKLRNHPDLISNSVEEVLRYESPANFSHYRFTKEEISVCGTTIPKDEFVFIAISAANRDESRFENPDLFDVERKATGHLTFGHGIHSCIGAALSRIEAEIAFKKLLEEYKFISLSCSYDNLVRRNSILHHGFINIPIKVISRKTIATQ